MSQRQAPPTDPSSRAATRCVMLQPIEPPPPGARKPGLTGLPITTILLRLSSLTSTFPRDTFWANTVLRSFLRCVSVAMLRRGAWMSVLIVLTGTAVSVDDAAAGRNERNVLVLTNGHVIFGRISQTTTGFMVQTESGSSILVPFDRVRIRASDLHDAYRRFLASFPNPSPDTHVALARWCLTQQLFDETKTELRAALKVNANHAEARTMLRRLEVILNPQNSVREVAAKEQPKSVDGFESPPVRSLAGLSRGAALDFVTKVQPLMMNTCALAGCHSTGSPTAFQLARTRLRPRSSRVLTERNLAATLQYIDRSDADDSPILIVPLGKHGRGGRPIFARSGGTDQFQLLRNWVRRIVAESPSNTTAAKPSGQPRDNFATSRDARANFTLQSGQQPRSASRGTNSSRYEVPKSIPDSWSENPIDTRSRPDGAEDLTGGDPLLEAILREERRDALDPAEFKRKSTIAVPR